MNVKAKLEGKRLGAAWVLEVVDIENNKVFYDYAFSLQEMRDMTEEYSWSAQFEIMSKSIV